MYLLPPTTFLTLNPVTHESDPSLTLPPGAILYRCRVRDSGRVPSGEPFRQKRLP